VASTARTALPPDEDGYELWLRHRPLPGASPATWQRRLARIVLPVRPTATMRCAAGELQRALAAMTGAVPGVDLGRGRGAPAAPADGSVLLATPRSWPALATHGIDTAGLGLEGYRLRALRLGRARVTVVAAQGERGLLYGAFALLRALACGADLATLDESSSPALPLRLLNHWDNLDRSVERGYAGESIWDWWKLPAVVDARTTDYARANASIGINGVVLNNVNARAEMLMPAWIAKAAAVADVLRPWGQRVYLSVRFSSPVELGELATADPLDAAVRRWWAAKVGEIVRAIPDFGGFLVKANSEGQPGPQDYGRSHAEGAAALAAALAPHGGVLFWRAFVYAAENPRDRAMQAYDEFLPLDGRFAANALVQVKNGPVDFQPREPFHPLFGAMTATPLAMEFQVTKEYLGFSTHLAYLGPMWQEALAADTGRPAPGTPVAATIAAMAGVANVGSDRNWCGSHFDQANWYAFGRLAWNPRARADTLAAEWVQQTFTRDAAAVRAIVSTMMASREAVVNYMTPLGLHHLMATGHHHGPGPWVDDLPRADWNPTYFHRAGRDGIGFDRTPRGSGAVNQYASPIAERWSDPRTTPDELLLWFHHLPWGHRLRSGHCLWRELLQHYDRGVQQVRRMCSDWKRLAPHIDARRHRDVSQHLAQQLAEAQWWRDACIAYFQSVSGLPLPGDVQPPAHGLDHYRAQRFPFAPGRGG